jgi:calcium-dependent protein kinase
VDYAKVHDLYTFEEKLGEGSFGTVWRARGKTGQGYAVKCIELTNSKSLDSAGQEYTMIKRLSNPYIVRLHHVVQEEKHLYLVIDLCRGGDLCQYLVDYWNEPHRRHQMQMLRDLAAPLGLPWTSVGPWAWQMLVAVAYLHLHRIIHRDIKAANFMLREDRDDSPLQLIDFGYAARYRSDEIMTRQVGTARYMAPEVVVGKYTEKYDIWSTGVVVYLLTLNKYPYNGRSVEDIIRSIKHGNRADIGHDWVSIPVGLRNLIHSMLNRDFQARPSAKELLSKNTWLRRYGRNRGSHGCTPCNQRQCCTIS